MAKSIKLKFDRNSEFKGKNYCITKKMYGEGLDEKLIKEVYYEASGRVVMKGDGFETIIDFVDELQVILKPLDDLFLKVSFEISRTDDRKTKLPMAFYGLREFNILLDYKYELGANEDLNSEIES